jgi:hypothetical protein
VVRRGPGGPLKVEVPAFLVPPARIGPVQGFLHERARSFRARERRESAMTIRDLHDRCGMPASGFAVDEHDRTAVGEARA